MKSFLFLFGVAVAALVVVVFVGVIWTLLRAPSKPAAATEVLTATGPTGQTAALPNYEVLADDLVTMDGVPVKRTVSVLLESRVTEDQLSRIAKKLLVSTDGKVERAYVNFDVDGEETQKPLAHWAVVRTEPSFSVQINY
jgi:hypothetical protein